MNISPVSGTVPTAVPFTYELLLSTTERLTTAFPFIRKSVIGTTDFGRELQLLKIGSGERRVMFNASHHANEWITTTTVLKFLDDYARAFVDNTNIFSASAAELYAKNTLFVVPMVDPDGVDLVTGALQPGDPGWAEALAISEKFPDIPFPDGWKANLNGVDLNLNYPAGWEQARENKLAIGIDGPAPSNFVGDAPFDQPETRAMGRLTAENFFSLTISLHTQGEVIFWRFRDYEPEGALEIAEELSRVSGYAVIDTPFESGFAGYKDWFIQDYNKPGYTVEAGLGVNPLPPEDFDGIYERCGPLLEKALELDY